MIYVEKLLVFLSLYLVIFCSTLKEGDTVSLVLYEYRFNKTEYNLTLLNKGVDIIDSFQTKMAYMKNNEEDSEIFDYYSKYFNRIWIFFAKDSETVNNLLAKDFNEKDINVIAIIISKNLNYTLPKNNSREIIPIFEIEENYTDELKSYDIRNNTKEIFFLLKINRLINNYPENYLFFISLSIGLLGIFILIIWKVLIKMTRFVYILNLHKILSILIHLHILLGLVLIIKSLSIRGETMYGEYDSSIFIDAILVVINTIYRTALWFFILLVSHGWGISVQELGREDFKYFFKIFFAIYLIICLDQLIDSLIPMIWLFYVSEIKNLIFYIYMLYLLLYKIRKNLKFLERKYYYAAILSPDYLESLIYKIKLVKKLRLLFIFYLPLYISTLTLHKTIFIKYDNSLLELYDYLSLDIILEALFLFLLRPKKLPDNYNIDYGEANEETGLIYNYKLPNYSEAFNNNQKITHYEIVECQEHNFPIIIIGPNNSSFNNNFIRNGGDTSFIGNIDINKYFNNLQIGYSIKE